MTYEQLRDALRDAISERWSMGASYCWVRDFDDSTVWFELEGGGQCHTYQADYAISGDTVTVGESVTEVEAVTTWAPVSMSFGFEPVRKDDVQQVVFGWANVSIRKDGTTVVDSQGEHVPVEDLETAAYLFTMSFRESGEDHAGEAKGTLIESLVTTTEKQEAMGLAKNDAGEWPLPQGWWVGFHYPDRAVYDTVKTAKGMFSIQGRALRVPVAA